MVQAPGRFDSRVSAPVKTPKFAAGRERMPGRIASAPFERPGQIRVIENAPASSLSDSSYYANGPFRHQSEDEEMPRGEVAVADMLSLSELAFWMDDCDSGTTACIVLQLSVLCEVLSLVLRSRFLAAVVV